MLLIADVAFVAEPLNLWRTHAGTVRHRTATPTWFEESLKVRRYICSHAQ